MAVGLKFVYVHLKHFPPIFIQWLTIVESAPIEDTFQVGIVLDCICT